MIERVNVEDSRIVPVGPVLRLNLCIMIVIPSLDLIVYEMIEVNPVPLLVIMIDGVPTAVEEIVIVHLRYRGAVVEPTGVYELVGLIDETVYLLQLEHLSLRRTEPGI